MVDSNQKLALSIPEAALALGISKNLAYELARRGQLPGAIRLGQKRILVSRFQLEAYLRGKDNNGQH